MHLNSGFILVQENGIAATIDQQALMAGNYVGVTEILCGGSWKFFQGAL